MGQQLDAQAGAILKTSMEELGIHVHLQKGTTAILGKEQVTGLAFKDGTTLDCDMVVIAAGIKPNAELALRCGLSVERAIMVGNSEGVAAQLDAAMQESIDVYVDPWKEAHAPVTPTQFASILPAQHER